MQKIIYSLLFFLVGTSSTFSQVFQNALKDSVIYLTPAEEAFMIDKESKYLFKIYPLGSSLADVATRQTLSLAFEKKISNAFSISALANFPQNSRLGFVVGEDKDNIYWKGGLELRYYHQMPRLIKANKQANNLSGNYFGAKFEKGWHTGAESEFQGSYRFSSITYGIQKRFLNRGFIDFSINLSNLQSKRLIQLFDGPRERIQNSFYLSAGIKAGIAFGKNYAMSDDLVCPIFKCYSNRKSALKINLVRNWSIGKRNILFGEEGSGSWGISIAPNVSYELKLANSPLSFEQDLDVFVYFSDARFNEPGFGINSYSLRYHAGFRFYHGMRNRIKKGQSGNNLSGFYSFARAKLEQLTAPTFEYNPDTGLFYLIDSINKELEAQVGIGYQKEVLQRLYFDLGIGATKDIKLNLNRALQGIRMTSYIKVGLMF